MIDQTRSSIINIIPPGAIQVARRSVLAATVICSLIVLYIAQASLPSNALKLPFQEELDPQVTTVLPQGWAFFTKSPRDEEFMPFILESGALQSIATGTNSDARHGFGLSRSARVQGIELALLLHENALGGKDWVSCMSLHECAREVRSSGVLKAKNSSPAPTLCGAIVLVSHEPRPWAWRDLVDEHWRPVRALPLKVECPT